MITINHYQQFLLKTEYPLCFRFVRFRPLLSHRFRDHEIVRTMFQFRQYFFYLYLYHLDNFKNRLHFYQILNMYQD